MGDTAADARRILGHIHGGRVLDVATGRGGFIGFLADGLADYDEIVGIELDESADRTSRRRPSGTTTCCSCKGTSSGRRSARDPSIRPPFRRRSTTSMIRWPCSAACANWSGRAAGWSCRRCIATSRRRRNRPRSPSTIGWRLSTRRPAAPTVRHSVDPRSSPCSEAWTSRTSGISNGPISWWTRTIRRRPPRSPT